MQYKIIITVIREDEAEVSREYLYKKDTNYQEEVEDIISSLEAEI